MHTNITKRSYITRSVTAIRNVDVKINVHTIQNTFATFYVPTCKYISRFVSNFVNAISRYSHRAVNKLSKKFHATIQYIYHVCISLRVFHCNAILTFLSRWEQRLCSLFALTLLHAACTGHLTFVQSSRYSARGTGSWNPRIRGGNTRTCVTRRTKPYPKVSRLTLRERLGRQLWDRSEAKRRWPRTRNSARNRRG